MIDSLDQKMRPMAEAPQGPNVPYHPIMAKLADGSWRCITWDLSRGDEEPAGWRICNANGTNGRYVEPLGWLSEEDYYATKNSED